MTVSTNSIFTEEGNICISNISGEFGIGHFNISAKEYNDAWQYVYQVWLFKDDKLSRSAPSELYVTKLLKTLKIRVLRIFTYR